MVHAPRPAHVIRVATLAVLALALTSGTVLAGKPGGGGATSSSSLRLVMVADQDADGLPDWGDQVTFAVSTTDTTKPWVRLDCYQGGAWVSTSSAGFFADYPWPPNFTLASGGWTSGAADCTATLYKVTSNGRTKTLATLGFHVGA